MHDYYISFLKEGDADYVIYCEEANVIAYFWKNLHLNVNSSGRVLRSKAKFDFLSPTKESKKEIVYEFVDITNKIEPSYRTPLELKVGDNICYENYAIIEKYEAKIVSVRSDEEKWTVTLNNFD